MTNKIRVMFIHKSLRQGGTSRQILYLYRGIDRSRFEPSFILYRKDRIFYDEWLSDDRVHLLRQDDDNYLQRMRRLGQLVAREQPDIIESFNPSMNKLLFRISLFYKMPRLYASVRNTNLTSGKRLRQFLMQLRFSGLIVNSRGVERELKRGPLRIGRMHLIYNALDTSVFRPCEPAQIASLREKFRLESSWSFPSDAFILRRTSAVR